MYKSLCACSGEEQTSVFVKPETCEDDFHKHHKHNDQNEEIACVEHECHECASHTNSCGCDSPEVFFFKLKDKVVNEDVKFTSVVPTELTITFSELLDEWNNESDFELETEDYNLPPPKVTSSLEFLIQIQQLKIPSIA